MVRLPRKKIPNISAVSRVVVVHKVMADYDVELELQRELELLGNENSETPSLGQQTPRLDGFVKYKFDFTQGNIEVMWA